MKEEATLGGIYDFNARFYDPVIGRFLSADTVVPGAGNPQALNKYSYTFNNPLRYIDPDGHCPTPPKDFGPAICMALFIRPSQVSVAGGAFMLHGDGRGFSSASQSSQSRGYIWISVNEDKHQWSMTPTGYIQKGIEQKDTPSGNYFWKTPDSVEWQGPSSQNTWRVKRVEKGEITVDYDLVLAGILQDIAPHINGSITFEPDGRGGYTVRGERDGFPWAEAYLHDGKGGVKMIFRSPAIRGNPEDLNAIENNYGLLKPFHSFRARFLADPYPQTDTFCKAGGPC
jgi:RHS repeat-associated protein